MKYTITKTNKYSFFKIFINEFLRKSMKTRYILALREAKKLYNLLFFMKTRGWNFKTFREIQADV